MGIKGYLTLIEMGERYGLDPSTLRHQRRKGRLHATKIGNVWLVADREAERYARESLGQPSSGRPPAKPKRKAATK